MEVVVASQNPVKLNAVQTAFSKMFPGKKFKIRSVSVDSEVGDMPMTNRKTLEGARTRAKKAKKANPKADFWVGLEGGAEVDNERALATFAWVVVLGKQYPKLEGKAKTDTFYVPPEVAKLVKQGEELGTADDIVFGKTNSKQKNGAAGILTGDVVTRTSLYEECVVLALIPFKNPDLYKICSDLIQ